MKNKATLLAASGALVAGLSLSTAAVASIMDWDLVPYVGADAQWRRMDYKKDFGQNLTKKNYKQGNLYAGLKFNEYVGVEAGYESTGTIKRNATVIATNMFGTTFPGAIAGQSLEWNTRSKISGFHGNLIGFLPISDDYCLKLFGSVGIAQLKARTRATATTLNGIPLIPNIVLNFTKRKWVPRLSLGLQHMFYEQFGLRATATWENTARLKMSSRDQSGGTRIYSAYSRDSVTLGVGLFYNFK